MRVVVPGLLFVGLAAGGCAGRALRSAGPAPVSAVATAEATPATVPVIAGVWDGVVRDTVADGMGGGDSRVERQEWHLDQRGQAVTGYYLAALTFTSGDGRPYICSRQASFSALVRFDVSGEVRGPAIDLVEVAQNPSDGRCTPGRRPLARYRAEVRGDVLTLIGGTQPQTLYRNHGAPQASALVANGPGPAAVTPDNATIATLDRATAPAEAPRGPAAALQSQLPADVSGVWIWEHRGPAVTGDEKQEREEWHVDQDGDRISGYYDRVVREISTDGHAFKCSMDLEFEIATRYRIHGEIRGNQLLIYENGYEVLEPNACDNGQRRLDAYEGLAAGDEVRLIWGVGGQVLRRPRPDVPTQRF